ncbi:MAG: ornithine cyclodeaminase family protein [Acidobacteriota bacterium]|nr:ornithine cyclodeaminase family protein [Acidobacteriota bacterium]MDH3525323.1 ornithine cyclodeaminase family protein [Acidobacteriota bacterium]
MKTLLLTQSEVRSALTMEAAVAAVEEAFAAHGRGETLMPGKVYLDLPQHAGDFRAMPAYAGGSAGVKWVNSHPENPERFGLPTVLGIYVLSDAATAEPLAVMDATYLTAARTGAAAAVASRHLARPGSRTVGFVGCGVQAPTALAALRVVFGDLEVLAHDRKPEAAEAFAADAGGRAAGAAEACGCDIVCTATPSHHPVVERDWIRPGTHVNALGADGPGKQELDGGILRAGKVVVDDLHQAIAGGEINVPLAAGQLALEALHATLGEIVAGAAPGRENDGEITIFDSTGLAIQDVAVARLVYDEARRRGLGRRIDFRA